MSSISHARLANILLADDSMADLDFVELTLERYKIKLNLHTVRDGDEALVFLKKEAEYQDAPTPDLIFLDINMCRVGGKEVLAFLQNEAELKHIPAIMLSGSDAENDEEEVLKLGATHYLVKPLDHEKIKEVVAMIDALHFEPDGDGKSLHVNAA